MSLTLDQQVKWLFRLNAVINVLLSTRGILDPEGMAALFGGPVPNYPFLIRLWSGLVFMFGIMFWETSRDVRKKSALIKYNWIEKLITASAVTLGFVAGDVPTRLMVLIIFTNGLWIPFILYYNIRLSRDMKAHSNQESDTFRPRDGVDSPDLGAAWLKQNPNYENAQKKTTRRFPLVRWYTLRDELDVRQESRRAQFRFRRDPGVYLAALENKLLQLSLPL